jgi:hypothetical protein
MNPTLDAAQLPLRDIHLPAPVGWWPPAPGWWLIAALAIAAGVVAALRWRRTRSRRTALRSIARAIAALDRGEDPAQCLQRLSVLLRRFAMTVGDAAAVAGLSGEAWLEYLNGRCPDGGFAGESGRRMLAASYRPPSNVTRDEALEFGRLCSTWVKAQGSKG